MANACLSREFYRRSYRNCECFRYMTSEEFKKARRELGLTQSQLGVILDTNPATIRKWEMNGDRSTSRAPNPVASRVMAWLLRGFRPPEFPATKSCNKGAE